MINTQGEFNVEIQAAGTFQHFLVSLHTLDGINLRVFSPLVAKHLQSRTNARYGIECYFVRRAFWPG
jgi:hypothetical protein